MKQELEPLDVTLPTVNKLWLNVTRNLMDNPEGILPVYLWGRAGVKLGKFFATFPLEEGRQYLQFEGFDTPELARIFLENSADDWQIHPGGIYRLEL